MRTKKELLSRAQKIRLLAMDVDGVLTRGDVVVLESGEEIKFWNAKDRLVMALLRDRFPEFQLAWITGRKSNAVTLAAEDLGVKYVVQHSKNKKEALLKIAQEIHIEPTATAFIGDDLIDLPAIQISGFSASPSDAVNDVRDRVDYVSPFPGGQGVVRDVIEFILKAQNKWDPLVQSFLD